MLTDQQLAVMTARNVIFHDVPNQRGDGELVLATEPTIMDSDQRRLLQDKLRKVLNSRAAYGVIFAENSSSPVPGEVTAYTSKGYSVARFVSTSQALAKHLHQVQHGAVSPGLLCVIDVVVDGRHGMVLMKLEREAGAQLELVSAEIVTIIIC